MWSREKAEGTSEQWQWMVVGWKRVQEWLRKQQSQQLRPVKTAEAGALGRFREPILTAGLQCVVLPWITPSEGRRAAVRMEGGVDGNTISSWTGALRRCVFALGFTDAWSRARDGGGPNQAEVVG